MEEGEKPEQYLFTITDEFSDNWKSFKEEAKDNNQNISELLRNTVSSKLKNNAAKKALVLRLMMQNWAAEEPLPSLLKKVGKYM